MSTFYLVCGDCFFYLLYLCISGSIQYRCGLTVLSAVIATLCFLLPGYINIDRYIYMYFAKTNKVCLCRCKPVPSDRLSDISADRPVEAVSDELVVTGQSVDVDASTSTLPTTSRRSPKRQAPTGHRSKPSKLLSILKSR